MMEQQLNSYLQNMTLEEKVDQLLQLVGAFF